MSSFCTTVASYCTQNHSLHSRGILQALNFLILYPVLFLCTMGEGEFSLAEEIRLYPFDLTKIEREEKCTIYLIRWLCYKLVHHISSSESLDHILSSLEADEHSGGTSSSSSFEFSICCCSFVLHCCCMAECDGIGTGL